MPVITSYRHGTTAGTPPKMSSHPRAKRGKVGGWSVAAARRNTQFLYSVREGELDGYGYAVTLTLRDCPPTARAWHRLRRAWEMRLKRHGMVRLHWVTEWQRRGVPHLHAALWIKHPGLDRQRPGSIDAHVENWVVSSWLMAGAESLYRAGWQAQDVRRITGAVGWFQYLSKHAARGVRHYQRNAASVPAGWQMETGRVWGRSGQWPVSEPRRFLLGDGDGGYFAFRRIVRGWRRADARSSGDLRRLRAARGMLRCHDRALSTVRGLSEWLPEGVQASVMLYLAASGFEVIDESTGEVVGR